MGCLPIIEFQELLFCQSVSPLHLLSQLKSVSFESHDDLLSLFEKEAIVHGVVGVEFYEIVAIQANFGEDLLVPFVRKPEVDSKPLGNLVFLSGRRPRVLLIESGNAGMMVLTRLVRLIHVGNTFFLGFYPFPARRKTFLGHRMRPMRRLCIVVDVVFSPIECPIDGPIGWKLMR